MPAYLSLIVAALPKKPATLDEVKTALQGEQREIFEFGG